MTFDELSSPLPEMKVYGALSYPYQFMIVCEMRMGDVYKDWTGYTATYKNISSKKSSIRIEGIWNNFDDAKKACEAKVKELK